ncbi:MAG: prolipoprotein diacylglyceryl transferase [Clostridia bacterium]|nr:prolipoprotein diacylglyceryl transferase [Clostridia bacterium]
MATPSSRLLFGTLPWYGLLIVLGAGLAIFLANREANRLQFPPEVMIDLSLWLLPCGILGARLYYVLFSWDTFADHPLSILYIWQGGLAIYGGIIFGFLTIWLFCKRKKLSLPRTLDVLIPGVALAQAIGRWGNYFNQEAFGLLLSGDSPFASFPLAVFITNDGLNKWHLATFFYESVWDFSVFLFLCWGRKHLFRKEGDPFFFYLFLYAAGRLVIENLRTDSLMAGSNLRVSQWLSVLLISGILIYYFQRYRKRKSIEKHQWFLFCVTMFFDILVLGFCAGGESLISIQPFTILLAGFSLWNIFILLFFYGRSSFSEVIYANHEA